MFLDKLSTVNTCMYNISIVLKCPKFQQKHLLLHQKILMFYITHERTTGVVKQTYTMTGPQREKTCLRGGGGVANNKGTDQPAHPHSLISAIVIHLLESIISRLARS